MRPIRKMAAVLAVAAGLAAAPAQADVKLKLAHVAPPQTTYQDAAVRFSDKLSELSGGTMTTDIIPGGALGDLNQLWVQNRTGSLDLHLIDIAAMIAMKEARHFMVMWAPFLFRDQAHFHRFIDGEIFAGMMKKAEEGTGLIYLGQVGDRPPRALTTAKTAVRTPADVKGLKVRTPPHPLIINTFKHWGANATPIKASELFTALKTGLVDGQDNGVIDFIGAGYTEAQKFYMPLDYIHSGIGLWMSGQKWASLTEEQRGWVREAAAHAGAEGRKIHAAQMAESLNKLSGLGVTLVEPDMDAFRTATQPMIDGMEGKFWAPGSYAQINGL